MKYYDITDLEVASSGLMQGTQYPWMPSGLHRHGEIEINVLESGSVLYTFGGTRKEVKENEIALFWAAIPHQVIRFEESTILHWLNVPFHIFLQWQLPHNLNQKVVRGEFITGSIDIKDQSVPIFFKQWGSDLHVNSPDYQRVVLLEVEAFLYRFALSGMLSETPTALQEYTQKNRVQHEMSRVEQMASFIVEHHAETLHVQEVADAVHLSPNYAMNIFREYFGISILDYITQYRISHAQRLLVTSNDNISEIAFASGFGSLSSFYLAFQKHCGLSPRAYRTAYSLTKKQRGEITFR